MGLLILFGATLGLGILLVVGYTYSNYGSILDSEIVEGLGMSLVSTSILAYVVMIGALVFVPSSNSRLLVQYEEDKAYIESVYDSTTLTEGERERVITLIMKNNKRIKVNKIRIESFWRNIFYPQDISNLETFDVSKVPPAIPTYSVEIK